MKKYLRIVTLLTLLSSVTLCGWATTPIAVVEAIPVTICNGAGDGSINITPSGGTSPYTYHWSNGATTQDLSGLTAGTYTVTITDNTGVTAAFSYSVSQYSAFLITKSITDENCGGQDIGAVTLSVSGSTPGYSYQWSNGATTENLSNLTAAVYYLTVTDANGCTAIDSANVTQPVGIGITMADTDASCSAGANNGAIGVTVQYGVSPYQYLWNNGATTQNLSGLAAGTYALTVTDSIGCTAVDTTVINQLPGGISINTTPVNPGCYNGANGTITITSVVGSTSPYTFVWNDAATTQNRTGLAAGTYTVTVTSSVGCTASTSVTLSQPTEISVTFHTFPLNCYGGNNGAINTTASAGTSPYSYVWSNGDNVADISGLVAGNYTVTVIDFKGCSVVATDVVSQPAELVVSTTVTPLGCSGGATGSVFTDVSGGTPTYSYWWGGGVFSADRLDVNAGTYTVTVTDAHGCTTTTSATIEPYTPMSLTSSQTDVVCYGSDNASLNITVNNGSEPYAYSWNNADTTADIDSLVAGTYVVTVTDANSCTITKTCTINSPPFPTTVNSTVVDVSCFGLDNGSLLLNPINGAPPYNYKWGTGSTAAGISNLAAGNYVVTITDSSGCKTSEVYTVTQPALITPVATVINDSCFGSNTGSIDLSVTGGFSPFSYAWNDGVDSQDRVKLYAGTYTVTVTDNHGCSVTSSATVSQPAQITLNTTVVNPSCFGGNGSATVTASGGTPGYSYNWGSGVSTQTLTGAPPGTYTVTVTDNMGCTSHASKTLVAPPAINITSTATGVACNGGNNGVITLNVTGGTAPYGFNWGGGVTSQNRNNLASGNYTVTVTDSAGCTATSTTSVTESTTLTITSAVTNIQCFGMNDGAIIATANGGTSPYSYNWSNGDTLQQINNVAAGTYVITVTDHSGCSTSLTSVISQPALLSVSSVASPTTCFGSATGAIQVTVTGGTAPYSYNWGGGITSQNRANIATGNYTVTVTDSVGCSVVNVAVVNGPAQITISSTQTNVACNGLGDGSIQLTVTGGRNPYGYNWGGGVTSQNRTGLAAGSYTVTVTDNNGCTAAHNVNITQPNVLAVNATAANATCSGGATGAVSLAVSGGTANYNYSWNTGATTQNISSLDTGSYAVTVTDANACTATATANIVQVNSLAINLTAVNVACFGQSTGSIQTVVTGGSGNYNYSWSNSSTTANIAGVPVGTYNVTVTDVSNCNGSASAVITQPGALTVTPDVTNAACFGTSTGSVQLTTNGGTGGYQYLWNNGSTSQNLNNTAAGNYTVTVKDANACSVTDTVTISQPAQINVGLTGADVTCNGGNNGAITTVASGGTGALTYAWSNGATTANISNLRNGNYTITVEDASHCTVSSSANITQPLAIVITPAQVNVACNGGNNGSVSLQVSGGAGGYSYSWNNHSTTQQINQLSAGSYTVTVQDANLCTASTSVTITQPQAISITSTQTNYYCASAAGTIQLSVSGGTSPYSYKWQDGSLLQNRTGLAGGTYTVTVTDNNNCPAVKSTVISQVPQLSATLTTTNITCFGGDNGTMTVTANGGTQPYRYSWSNTATTNEIKNLTAAAYSVLVTDANLCSVTADSVISQTPAMHVSPAITNVSCYGQSNGAVNVTVTGGTPLYSYLWNNNSTTQSISNLVAGAYQITVTDANNCTTVLNDITVSQPAPLSVTGNVNPSGCSDVNNGSIEVNGVGGTPPYSYSWSTGLKSAGIDSLTAGNYTVTVNDINNCSTIKVFNIAASTPLVVTATVQNTACTGVATGSVSVTVTGGTLPYNYDWSNGQLTATDNDLAAGTYNVTITDAGGCSAESGGTILTTYELTVNASASSQYTTGGQVQLTAATNVDHGNTYNWTPVGILTCSTCASTAAFPQQTTLFTVYVVDVNGCKASDTVSVNVNNSTDIFIPNAFTPNGDGVNDQFKMFGDLSSVNFMDMAIFDRWGEKVFESNDANFEWDGTYKGEPAPLGVYVYVATISFNDGSHRDYKGSVTLLR